MVSKVRSNLSRFPLNSRKGRANTAPKSLYRVMSVNTFVVHEHVILTLAESEKPSAHVGYPKLASFGVGGSNPFFLWEVTQPVRVRFL